jgi:hypothetical protein
VSWREKEEGREMGKVRALLFLNEISINNIKGVQDIEGR